MLDAVQQAAGPGLTDALSDHGAGLENVGDGGAFSRGSPAALAPDQKLRGSEAHHVHARLDVPARVDLVDAVFAPLLKQEGHFGECALVAQVSRPSWIHRACVRAALAADDDPVDSGEATFAALVVFGAEVAPGGQVLANVDLAE